MLVGIKGDLWIRPRRALVALCLAIFVVTPLLAGKLTVDHDPEVDFTPFRTFAWPPDKGLRAARPDIQSVIVRSIDKQLEAKGLRKVELEEADLHIVTYAVSESFGGTVTGFYRPPDWGFGFITVDSRMVSDGALVVDIYDAGEERLIWHALAKDSVSSREQAKRKVDGYVNKAFRQFPPKTKGK